MENKINVKLLSMAGQGGSAFGITLMELMKERDDIMVLSADMSTPAGLDKFKTAYPDHFLNVGIAEQNMIGIAAGLADEGYKVVCVAQACFITMRCFEQVRQYAGYMGIPMVLVGIGSGLSLQYMGNTHYALEDIALMRTIPTMTVMAPCDALEACKALECAISLNSSSYIRLFGGTGIPVVHQDNFDFENGKSIVLREGKDMAILATGSMVFQALQVADRLYEEDIECEVVDVHTIVPFDKDALSDSTEKKLILTMEEHRLTGGLGSVVSEYMKEKQIDTRLLQIGIGDDYPKPGSYPFMLEQCGLSVNQIKSEIIKNIK
jgi:transketolase